MNFPVSFICQDKFIFKFLSSLKWAKWARNWLNMEWLSQNFIITSCWKQPQVEDFTILFQCTSLISGIILLHYRPIFFHAIILQESLIVNISERNVQILLNFCMEIFTKGRQDLRLTFDWLSPGVSSHAQTCLA